MEPIYCAFLNGKLICIKTECRRKEENTLPQGDKTTALTEENLCILYTNWEYCKQLGTYSSNITCLERKSVKLLQKF